MVCEAKSSPPVQSSLIYFSVSLIIVAAGFWQAWRWLFERLFVSPGEAIGMVGVLALLLIKCSHSMLQTQRIMPCSPVAIASLLILYGISFLLPFPAIFRAAFAVLAIAILLYQSCERKALPLSLLMLVLISLPVVPSLQFYLGYPARLVAASLTVPLLQLHGIPVSQEGTYLVWQGQMIQFDAPCSGVKMLWAGMWLSLFMAFLYQFNWLKTLIAVMLSCIVVLFGNVLRASSLFYLETGIISQSAPWMHEATGLSAFLIVAVTINVLLKQLKQGAAR